MGTTTGGFQLNPLKKLQETRLTIENLPKGHNSGKNQLSMTSVKHDHLQVMQTITGKFHQNPLKNEGGVVKMLKCDMNFNMILCKSWEQQLEGFN